MKKGTGSIPYKIRDGRYCCDVASCNNYAYAELHRENKDGWMYVCRKHHDLKFDRNGKPKEKDISLIILKEHEKRAEEGNRK